jgi:glutamyl-tRNA synthetase
VFLIRGRFAPSPTGQLHIGNARTALLAWLQARAAGGRFVMRVEDLDPGRVRPGYMAQQLDDLRWLGLDWDEGPDVGGPFGPYLQTERTERYEAALRILARGGRLFACSCTRRDLAAAASAPHAGEEGPRYPGNCRARPVDADAPDLTHWGAGEYALRFRVDPGPITFQDGVQGEVRLDPAELGDFVVRRKDGVAAYQLAVVVDDAAMGITDVVRGGDLLGSTPLQILLFRALGLQPPRFAHVPLMLGIDGDRLAKRHGAVSLVDLRERGVPPAKVVGWLATTCGLIPSGAVASPRDLVAGFDLAAIPREPTIVTPAMLRELVEGSRAGG